MTNNLIEKFKYLPDELIHIIINYTDVLVYRHGKYINRLNKADERYNLLTRIPRPITHGLHKVLIRLTDNDYNGYFLSYDMSEKLIKLNVRFFNRGVDGYDKYYEIKSSDSYLFDANNKWCKIVNYLM